jgi:hypothetical protein
LISSSETGVRSDKDDRGVVSSETNGSGVAHLIGNRNSLKVRSKECNVLRWLYQHCTLRIKRSRE